MISLTLVSHKDQGDKYLSYGEGEEEWLDHKVRQGEERTLD